ncbi:MAG TPA: ATP-binding cassette domain-containing protein [Acidimicrobiales bacterium]|nr:ATP-binding cassette domain-containing protein [Acidimicrobiales bacterium]
MSRETRMALARPHVRRGLWWSWLGGGLVYSALVEAPRAIDRAVGLSGPAVPAALGWLALGAGLIAYRLAARPRAGVLAALGPLAVGGIAPTPVVVATALCLCGLAGGWVVGAVCREAQRPAAAGPAGAGLSLVAAAGGFLLIPLSSLWLAALATVILSSASSRAHTQTAPAPAIADPDGIGVDAVLQGTAVSISFAARRVLDQISITLRPGELVALVGGNGSGKSTLLRVLSGHLLPDDGALSLRGENVLGSSPEDLARLGVTLASGARPVFPDLTVRENLQIATWITPSSRRERVGSVEAALARFPELTSLDRAAAGTLSGGEQRLLALAASLIGRPHVLLADEVTLGLSPQARRRALHTLRGVADSGAAVLVVEHELRDLLPLADRALVLQGGKLVETAEPLPAKASFIPEVER